MSVSADTSRRRPGGGQFHARVLEAEHFSALALERTDSDPERVDGITEKARIYSVRLDDVPLKASPMLKQEMVSVGGDAAPAGRVADRSVGTTPVVLIATWGQYGRAIPELRRQPFHLEEIADEVERALHNFRSRGPRTVHGIHRAFTVGDRCRVMGVVNVTPDSFSDGGKFLSPADAVDHARRLIAEGATVIDIGGESTRPGSDPVSLEVEWSRVGPVIAALHAEVSVPISIDTRNPEVASKAIEAGADLVNDVSGLRDPAMRQFLARTGAPVVVMHMRGVPKTMQENVAYTDVRSEVYVALAEATEIARSDGVASEQLLVDPGLGFGKSPEQSLELLGHLGEFRSLGYPVVVGASRKSFLGWALGGAEVAERTEAGVAAAVIASLHGAHLVRTHDVAATVRALKLVDALGRRARSPNARTDADGATLEPD